MKVFVEFDSVEQAAKAVAAVSQASAPVQQYAPQAPVQQFAPQQPQYAAPAAPVQQFAPQQQFIPAAAMAPQAPVPQAPTVTLKELTVAGQNYAKKHGAAQAKAVMAQFGIQKMTDTKPEQMASLFAALSV